LDGRGRGHYRQSGHVVPLFRTQYDCRAGSCVCSRPSKTQPQNRSQEFRLGTMRVVTQRTQRKANCTLRAPSRSPSDRHAQCWLALRRPLTRRSSRDLATISWPSAHSIVAALARRVLQGAMATLDRSSRSPHTSRRCAGPAPATHQAVPAKNESKRNLPGECVDGFSVVFGLWRYSAADRLSRTRVPVPGQRSIAGRLKAPSSIV
jgi:hypothetical protein